MPDFKSVIQALEATSSAHGALPAMRSKRDGQWEATTWNEYWDQVGEVAKGLMSLGIGAGHGTVILANNVPRWFFSHFGSIAAGAVPAGIYTNSTPEQCHFIIHHSEAVVALVENVALLEPLLRLRHRSPRLRAIVLMEGDHPDPDVHSWAELVKMGQRTSAEALQTRYDSLRPDDVCELIYTSGTTGTPKGVMLTHHNIIWLAARVAPVWQLKPGDSLISYLPLSHIAEQAVSLYNPVFTGACTWFAESLEKLGDNLREVRPHLFFAVPRVWEKIQTVVEARGSQASGFKRRLTLWARSLGLAGGYAEQVGRPQPILFWLADKWLFTRVREHLGLDRCRGAFSAAAPISLHTLEFFLGLGIPILEIYGLSENTGPATLSTRDRYRTGKAGFVIEGTELRIAEDGEICLRGPHISPGYFNNPEANRESFDKEGWLHTGDIGEIDDDGFLSITDRKKELIITSGGKKVAPQAIEQELRRIPIVDQAVVLGNRRHYLTALLTLDPEVLPREAAAIGSQARDLAAASRCPRVRKHLETCIEGINSQLARFETIKRFAVLDTEFSTAGGELTPTMKLKRQVINEEFASEIEQLYA